MGGRTSDQTEGGIYQVVYVTNPQWFDTPGDDGGRVDMMAHNFKPGWYWWPKLPTNPDPTDDPVGPFGCELVAIRDARYSHGWDGGWVVAQRGFGSLQHKFR